MKKLILSRLFVFAVLSLVSLQSLVAQDISKDSLSKHVHYLASEELEGRGLGTAGKDKATKFIVEQFRSAGLQPYQGGFLQDFELTFSLAKVKAHNVWGFVEGSDPQLKSEIIVLGAHYDHLGYKKDRKVWYPGADDNASGVATIIELAKYFGEDVNRPKRSILFIAFDAEESGLLGAKHFVEKLTPEERKKIKAMFSFDMVGMLSKNKGLVLKGVRTLGDGVELAKQEAKGLNLLNLSDKIEERTDTEPFGSVGIPAIHVFTGLKSPYHKPGDKAELLDYDGMKKIADFSARFVGALANQQEELVAAKKMQRLQENPKSIGKPVTLAGMFQLNSGKHLYDDEFYDAKSDIGFSLGLQMEYRFKKLWAVDLGGYFNNNASRSVEGRFERNSLMVPMSLKFGSNVVISAGPYYKYHFDGKNGNTDLDFENTFRRDEWGYSVGVAIEVMNYHVGWISRRSFHSIYSNGPKVIPIENGLSLGWRF